MTIPTQATGLTVGVGATHQDAVLLIELSKLAATTDVMAALPILHEVEPPYSYDEFIAKHRMGSPVYMTVLRMMQWFETVGTLVKNGLLNRALVYDWLAVDSAWARAAGIAEGMRAERADDRLWENFEALAVGQRVTRAG